MASHRKPRQRVLTATVPRAAVGVTAVAIASVTLLSESANAAPAKPAKPSIAEVKKQIDSLNQQAEVATEKYNQAMEKTQAQRTKTDTLLAEVSKKTEQMNDTRRVLGQFATAQYRDGGIDPTVQLLLSSDPAAFLNQSHTLDQLSATQSQALSTLRSQQEQVAIQRTQASESLAKLTSAQKDLAAQKEAVKTKLAAAQKLLNSLDAAQRAKLASMNKGSSSKTGYTYNGPASGRAAAAIQFALAQRGKPYVWGATGPNSFDCSGLTQAAYKAAGISIGRTTGDQSQHGVAVSKADLRPGDLVFFYSGLSHVGIYLGNGQIVHSPHTGATVEVAPLSWMPFATARRVA